MANKPTYEGLEQRVKELEQAEFEWKQAEIGLRESEGKYHTYIEQANDGISVVHNGKLTFVNSRLAEIMGFKVDELEGKDFLQFIPKGKLYQITDNLKRRLAGEEVPEVYESRILHKDSSEIDVEFNVTTIKSNDEPATLTIIRDITERKQAEEALRTSVQSWDTTFHAITDSVSLIDVDGKILQCNKATANFLGKPINEIVGNTCWELVHGTIEPIKGCPIVRMRETLRPESLELPAGDRVLHVAVAPVFDQDGNVAKAVHTITDITERKQAEEALRESEERFRTVADFTYDWEYWIAPDGRHIYVSPSCERITGYNSDEFLNDPGLLEKIVHPDDQSTFVTHLRKTEQREGAFDFDFRIITRDGKERWINHVCQPVYGSDGEYLGQRASNRDISKQKLIQEELLKAKKLESVGVLAGGIAHDFNNLLTSVVGYISLARIDMKPGSKAFQNLVEAEKVSIQTKELTARLITFSEGGGPVKETVPIGKLIKDSVNSLLKGSYMDVGFSIPVDISPAEVDEDQMKQVIRNIISNAKEAMAGQGAIKVSCENVNVGEKDPLTLKNGKYVKISIKDQGPGIPEENLAKIFDPYFSTKEMGTQKGLGLGLAVSDSIVKQHDGVITVESKLGTGTTFSIYLPASEKEIVEATPVKKPIPEISATQGEKILVMDDEEVVRDVSNALLTHLGYEVEVAVDGVEAIELYKKAMESEKPFEMVILDLTNKIGMGGAEAMVNLLEIDPDVKAIVASGYSNDPLMSNFREHGFRAALPKPFNLDKLKEALHDAITGE